MYIPVNRPHKSLQLALRLAERLCILTQLPTNEHPIRRYVHGHIDARVSVVGAWNLEYDLVGDPHLAHRWHRLVNGVGHERERPTLHLSRLADATALCNVRLDVRLDDCAFGQAASLQLDEQLPQT